MAIDDQWELWDPFLSCDGLTAKQRVDKERGQALAAYFESGGTFGDLYYIDYPTWLKMQRGHER